MAEGGGAASADRSAGLGKTAAASQIVDLSEIIENQRLSGFILRLVAVSWVVTFFDGFDMNGIAYAAPYLSTALHFDKLMLGDIFSIGLAGTMIGGFGFGSLGDWIGRRPAIILATVTFGILTAALAFAKTYEQFLVLRLLNGIAIGGMLPLCWALNIEYAPKRFRATIVTIIMIGYTLGFSFAGPVAIWFIPHFGWPSLFLFGAVGSFLAAILLYFTLPESIRFLASKRRGTDIIAGIVRRIAPGVPVTLSTQFILADEAEEGAERFRVGVLFEGELRWITLLLWLAYAASSLGIFFGAAWGPVVLESIGFTRTTAAVAAAANSIGGALGALVLMRFTDNRGAISLSVMPAIAIPILLVCGLVPIHQAAFLALAFLSATLLGGTHFGLHSIAGIFYPSAYRGTGAGWATSVAKIGSIAGPLIGGFILSSHLPVRNVYALLAACPLVVAACTLVLGRLHSRILRRERATAEGTPLYATADPF